MRNFFERMKFISVINIVLINLKIEINILESSLLVLFTSSAIISKLFEWANFIISRIFSSANTWPVGLPGLITTIALGSHTDKD